MNNTIDMGNDVTAVILRKSEYKDTLIAGKDFFYVDTVSFSKMFIDNNGYWAITKRASDYVVSRRIRERKEIRLGRFLTDILEDRSSIVVFANECFYDLRLKNLLVGPIGGREWIEKKRAIILPELEELPKEIKNDLAEKNPHSIPQESLAANPLRITLELDVTDSVTLQYCPSTLEEAMEVAEMIKFLENKFTVVQR